MRKNSDVCVGDTITCKISEMDYVIHQLHSAGWEIKAQPKLMNLRVVITVTGRSRA